MFTFSYVTRSQILVSFMSHNCMMGIIKMQIKDADHVTKHRVQLWKPITLSWYTRDQSNANKKENFDRTPSAMEMNPNYLPAYREV